MDNNLKEKAKDFINDFEAQCKKEKEARYEEDDYFENLKNNFETISYDEEIENIEDIPFEEEDSNKKFICFIILAPLMMLMTIFPLITIYTPWGSYVDKKDFLMYSLFGFGSTIYCVYELIKIIKYREK